MAKMEGMEGRVEYQSGVLASEVPASECLVP